MNDRTFQIPLSNFFRDSDTLHVSVNGEPIRDGGIPVAYIRAVDPTVLIGIIIAAALVSIAVR